MPSFEDQILAAVSRRSYQPLKPKALARKLGVSAPQYADFRRALRSLHRDGRIEMGKNHTVKPKPPHGTVTGTYRRTGSGLGFVRPHLIEGQSGAEIRIKEDHSLDAATGDTRAGAPDAQAEPSRPAGLRRNRSRPRTRHAAVRRHLLRARGAGIGARRWHRLQPQHLRRRSGGQGGAAGRQGRLRDAALSDAGRPRRRASSPEILGPRGQPGVDTLSIIRAFGLPDVFAEDALEEARAAAAAFDETDLDGREDFTNDVVVTIDPADARDFDDAVSLTRDADSGHWQLTVHIADVGHFAPPGGAARPRGAPPRHQRLSAAARDPDVSGDHLQQPRQPAAGPAALRQKRCHRLHAGGPEDRRCVSPTAPSASAAASPTSRCSICLTAPVSPQRPWAPPRTGDGTQGEPRRTFPGSAWERGRRARSNRRYTICSCACAIWP